MEYTRVVPAKLPDETIEPIVLTNARKVPRPKAATEGEVATRAEIKAEVGPPRPVKDTEPHTMEILPEEIASLREPPRPPPLPPGATRGLALFEGLRVVDRDAYDIDGVFAEGGIGRILQARDVRLGRIVALKELLSAEPAVRTRFVREAIITARLEHPSIVPVHEAGYWPSGEPFFAMKLVSGRALSDVMKESTTLEQRLALLPHLLAVADAIAYAHSQRIVHRDLKPANVLVGQFGETVVIDWGLAKDLEEAEEEPLPKAREGAYDEARSLSAHLTMDGAIMGTPAYMPPEQACAQPVDERADVYAIGALMYRTLTGAPPYEGEDGLDVLAKVIEGPPVPLENRQKGIPEDLVAIVHKAMARAKDDRYRTAKELAEDLRRFQTGQIVGAHRYTRRELVRRFVKRRKAPLLVAAMALVMLALFSAISVQRVIRERNKAQESEAFAQQKKDEAEAQRADAQVKEAEAQRRADDLTLVQARGLLEQDPNAAVAWLKTLSAKSPRWLSARTLAADAAARGIGRVFRAHSGGVNAVAFSPDGRTIATASDDRSVRLWDLETGKDRALSGHTDEVWCAAFSPDGKLVATGGKDKTLRIWDVATGKDRALGGHAAWISSIRFSPDNQWITSQGLGEGVYLWSVESGKGELVAKNPGAELSRGAVFTPDSRSLVYVEGKKLSFRELSTGKTTSFLGQTSTATTVVLSADGRLAATGAENGTVTLWSTQKGQGRDFRGHKGPITALAFLPDTSALVSGSKDHTVRLVNLTTGTNRELGTYGGEIKTLQVSPDSRSVAAVGQDRNVGLWDVASGKGRMLGGFQDWLSFHGVAFSPDGKYLAAAGFDQTMRVWDLGQQIDRAVSAHESAATMALYLPDGERVLSAGDDGAVRLVSLRGGAPSLLTRHEGKVTDLRVFPDGSRAVSAGEDGALQIISLAGQKIEVWRGHVGRVHRVAVSPDGALLCSGGADKKVLLWDVATGKSRVLFEHDKPIEAIAFSPDGERVATGGGDNRVAVHHIASGQTRFIEGYERGVKAVTFSPDGRILATGSMDLTIRLWTVETGAMKIVPAGGSGVTDIVFFPGGEAFASMGSEPSVRIWDTATGASRGILRGHQGTVTRIAIAPDGKRLASASLDGTIRLWDLESHEDRKLLGHTGGVPWVAFSPDGRMLVSAGQDKTVRIWGDDVPWGEADLRAWMAKATPERIDWQGTGAPGR